jgi:hypothetical protein
MFDIVSSQQVRPRHLKMLFWGDTGTRKTEAILRHFPDVLLIDTEGNAEQCSGMPEIPEFLLAKTKDLDEIIQIVDDVGAGKYHFGDGRPVQTLALDSISVLWTIRKNTRALVAEQRSARYGRSPEDATMTQLDWTMAKRPLVRLNTRLANCPIKYVIYTARLQDKYKEDPKNRDRIIKIGEVPEAIKGLESDMNFVLRMRHNDDGAWECEVSKVQGALGKHLPKGKVLKTFPAKTILQYTGSLTGEPGTDQDETRLAEAGARREIGREAVSERPNSAAATAANSNGRAELDAFYAKARALGYATAGGEADRPRINALLRARGFRTFSPDKEAQLLAVLDQAARAEPLNA